jgi:hypothetical protein
LLENISFKETTLCSHFIMASRASFLNNIKKLKSSPFRVTSNAPFAGAKQSGALSRLQERAKLELIVALTASGLPLAAGRHFAVAIEAIKHRSEERPCLTLF